MLRMQTWEPDTHAAVLTLEWDDDDPEAPHVCVKAVVDGVEQSDPAATYAIILAENQMKNAALGLIVETLPYSMKKPVLDSDGDPTGQMAVKDKHQPTWDFGAVDGKIAFAVPGADDETRATISEKLAEQFGDAVTLIED